MYVEKEREREAEREREREKGGQSRGLMDQKGCLLPEIPKQLTEPCRI